MKKILFSTLTLLALQWSGAAFSADFVAVRIEAENYTSKSDRWTLTSATSLPDASIPDPDPPHHGSASGGANLELLPDTRVTHNDPIGGGPDGSFWGGPGQGPRIDYNIDMPEPGRYFVYVKTFATGTEDNGIHVGLNGTKPASGKKIQICSKHAWQWTSGQRTDVDHCGVTKTIWLDIPVAGTNTITLWAREDGFEVDQILLLKETHDGSLDCFPTFGDKMRCRNISTGASTDTVIPISTTVGGNPLTSNPIPTTPPPTVETADLAIDINVIGSTHYVNDEVELRVKVDNNDNANAATNAEVKVDMPNNVSFSASADCNAAGTVVTCNMGNIPASSNKIATFLVTVNAEGNHRFDSQITADQDDPISANDMDSDTISASSYIPDVEASASIVANTNVGAIGDITNFSVTVQNNGQLALTGASVNLNLGGGLSLLQTENCNPTCTVPTIAPGENAAIGFSAIATQAGSQTVNATIVAAGDEDNANDNASVTQTNTDSAVALATAGVVAIEAEAFSTSTKTNVPSAPTWWLVDGNFQAVAQDPDSASPADASGAAYLELLPDVRITSNDPEITNVTNVATGGSGATLSYQVFFVSAGDYVVQARIRANGDQDGTLHVGLNDSWPQSSANLSVCNPDGSWQWSSAIRGANGCSTLETAVLNVPTAGLHTIMISQSTDGLELDKIVLSKDAALSLTDAGPTPASVDVNARVDVALTTELNSVGGQSELTVNVANNSTSQDASALVVSIDGITLADVQSTNFDSCTATGNGAICVINSLAASQNISDTFAIATDDVVELNVNANVQSAITDDNSANNTSASTMAVAQKKGGSGGGTWTLWLIISLALMLAVRAVCASRQVKPVQVGRNIK